MVMADTLKPEDFYPEKPKGCRFGYFTSEQLANKFGVDDSKLMNGILKDAWENRIAWHPRGEKKWSINRLEFGEMVSTVLRITESEKDFSPPTKRKLPKCAIYKAIPKGLKPFSVPWKRGLKGLIIKLFKDKEVCHRTVFLGNVKRLEIREKRYCVFVDKIKEELWIYKKDVRKLSMPGKRGKHHDLI